MKIRMIIGDLEAQADLYDTKTARMIYDILPLESSFSKWGDEIYFRIPLDIKFKDNAKEVVEIGDLGYWLEGSCFCIFYGRTPVSEEDEIRPASVVNVFGKVVGDPSIFRHTRGSKIRVEKG